MSYEITNTVAVELSEQELDTVAGGLTINLGNGQGLSSNALNEFSQKNLVFAQQTTAGPNGSSTTSGVSLQEIFSKATQGLAVGN